MTRKEAIRQTHQEDTLRALGFTREEAEQLRRISMTLQRWYEKECGIDDGAIERDDVTGKAMWRDSISGRTWPVADRETGARKRLDAIIKARNERFALAGDGREHLVGTYLQTDPRGAALYILRSGDVPDGKNAESYYDRGICVY